MMPNVSVIIPTRNRCRLLSRAIESAQLAGTDIEIIVVDVASDDATANVCAALTGPYLPKSNDICHTTSVTRIASRIRPEANKYRLRIAITL